MKFCKHWWHWWPHSGSLMEQSFLEEQECHNLPSGLSTITVLSKELVERKQNEEINMDTNNIILCFMENTHSRSYRNKDLRERGKQTKTWGGQYITERFSNFLRNIVLYIHEVLRPVSKIDHTLSHNKNTESNRKKKNWPHRGNQMTLLAYFASWVSEIRGNRTAPRDMK